LSSGDTVTSEVAITVLSATLTTVTVTLVDEDTLGAVKSPVPVIVPALACHTTAVLLVEVSVAVNWTLPPATILALPGITLMWAV
jgi:hypothetical protein